jgi:hypothetical protein
MHDKFWGWLDLIFGFFDVIDNTGAEFADFQSEYLDAYEAIYMKRYKTVYQVVGDSVPLRII